MLFAKVCDSLPFWGQLAFKLGAKTCDGGLDGHVFVQEADESLGPLVATLGGECCFAFI